MERQITQVGFDNWMIDTIQSVHYLNNEKMEKAHERLKKPVPKRLSYGKIEIKIEENVNNTPKPKVFRSFRNPFSKQKISD